MAKDPAFLFYPGDWLGGTMGMTLEQKGAYMELLVLQFHRGHMTSHMATQVVGHHWDTLKDKFEQDPAGLFFNRRLEDEQSRRKSFTDSRKNNLNGKNQFTEKGHKTSHMTTHMENENENENRIKNKGGAGGKKYAPIDLKGFPETFMDQWQRWIQYKRSEFKDTYKTTMSEQAAFDRLQRISQNDPKEAEKIINHSIENHWKGLFELKDNANHDTKTSRKTTRKAEFNGL